ncbi:MAG: CotH kinase family protein [Saprospiraceae bacterium]|nr:CotH kinase family protein [Saprospiraceae bacterium]
MLRFTLLICTVIISNIYIFAQGLFEQNRVNSIHILIPEDSIAFLYANPLNERYLDATFVFEQGSIKDTVQNIGFRLRGSSSRISQKKSFKISFNEFSNGRKFYGAKKLNLNGQHNDPTMVREKLFYDCWNQIGLPERRTAFIKLYINYKYYGLYTQLEEFDKEWLQRNFPDEKGNLYKCTYPADLRYLGNTEDLYKNILSHSATGGRAYDLLTNETKDDYSGFLQLIFEINKNPIQPASLERILNVPQLLKAYALEVCTGHWDNYAFNKNNYFLYQPPGGAFTFISYDADNTFGIDWLNIDWAERDPFNWYHPTESRTLIKNILKISTYQAYYKKIIDSIASTILNPAIIFPKIDSMHILITESAIADSFRTLDYNYSVADFHNGFSMQIDKHSPYGIKPFIERRRASILKLTTIENKTTPAIDLKTYYDLNTRMLTIKCNFKISNFEIFNLQGFKLYQSNISQFDQSIRFELPAFFTPNIYLIKFQMKNEWISKLLFL